MCQFMNFRQVLCIFFDGTIIRFNRRHDTGIFVLSNLPDMQITDDGVSIRFDFIPYFIGYRITSGGPAGINK
jgi:hypothetical protein